MFEEGTSEVDMNKDGTFKNEIFKEPQLSEPKPKTENKVPRLPTTQTI